MSHLLRGLCEGVGHLGEPGAGQETLPYGTTGRRYAQSETGRWDETSGDALGVEVKHRFAYEPMGAGTMGGRWAKRGSGRWQGVLVFRGYIALGTKRKPAGALR